MRKRLTVSILALTASGSALADDVSDTDSILCALNQSTVCTQGVPCHSFLPVEIDVPQFIVLDTRKRVISTTEASGIEGESQLDNFTRDGGLIIGQGREGERVFSVVIDEATGVLTTSSATDGYTISSFGSCTNADVKS